MYLPGRGGKSLKPLQSLSESARASYLFFICSVPFLFAAFLFYLQRFFFYLQHSFFYLQRSFFICSVPFLVCSVPFLFAAFLFCLHRFFFCLQRFFYLQCVPCGPPYSRAYLRRNYKRTSKSVMYWTVFLTPSLASGLPQKRKVCESKIIRNAKSFSFRVETIANDILNTWSLYLN